MVALLANQVDMSTALEDECLKQLLPVALPIREAIAINRPFARQSFLGDIGVISGLYWGNIGGS